MKFFKTNNINNPKQPNVLTKLYDKGAVLKV